MDATTQDFAQLRQLFAPLCQETDTKLLAYCLFQNSLHLVLRAGGQGIIAAAQWLVDTHTQRYNEHNQRHGSVFSPQILATLVEPQHYLLPIIFKLHRLPVSAGLVASPLAYPWCSHRDYLAAECPSWLDRQEVLIKVANHRATQLRRYEHFIEDSIQPPVDWVNGVNQQYRALASESYIQRLLSRTREHQILPALDLDTLTEWICAEYQLEEKDLILWRHHRLGSEVQAVIGALAQTYEVADLAQVAGYFRADAEVLASGIRALKARRGMYLFKLQLRLDQWLINQFQQSPAPDQQPDENYLQQDDREHTQADFGADPEQQGEVSVPDFLPTEALNQLPQYSGFGQG